MRVTKVEAIPIRIPLKEPYVISRGSQTTADYVVVFTETDEGITGIGEAAPFPGLYDEGQADIILSIRSFLAHQLIGMDPFDLEAIHANMNQTLPGHLLAKSALDISLHDIIGKAVGQPLCKLIGGVLREKIQIIGGLSLSKKTEALTFHAEELVRQGYEVIKVKIGVEPDRDVEVVGAVRKAVGNHVKIRVDANQGYTPDIAIKTIRKMEKYDLQLVEQPTPSWDLEGLARVSRALDTPVMADESVVTPQDAMKIARKEAADNIKVKVMRCGGLLPSRKICAIADAADIPIIIGSGHETGIGVAAELALAAATKNAPYAGEMVGNLRLVEDIIGGELQMKGGWATVPLGKGLGISIDQQRLSKFLLR